MQRIDDRSCQESDISGANRHRRTAHQRKQAIEEPRWPALERAFSFRLGAYALHDDSACAPRVEERGNRFGRVLPVGIHHQDHLAASFSQSSQDRSLMAKIPRELNAHDVRVRAPQALDRAPRTVSAAIIHHDDLVGRRSKCPDQRGHELRKRVGFVMRRQDDREGWPFGRYWSELR